MSPALRWSTFVLVAVVGVAPAVVRGHVVGDGVDAFGTVWFYWWIRQCVEQFGDPSFTDLFFHPYGKDIFADTGNNFVDAVMSVPFQWAFGPVLYSPVYTALLVVGNAAAFWPLARYLWGDSRAAFLATLLWQTNPWILFEFTAGRPTQGMAWFLPLTVWYLLRSLREPGWRAPVLLGTTVAVAGWTYWFNGFFLIFLGMPLVVVEGWRARGDGRRVALRLGLALVVCAGIVLPAALPMWEAIGAGEVPGLALPPPGGPKHIANNVQPELHGLWLMETQGSPLYTNPWWGLPTLLALLWPRLVVPGGAWAWRLALLVPLWFSFGLGAQLTDALYVANPAYRLLHDHLPFFGRLWFPYRIVSVAFIPTVILVTALWLRLGARTWVGVLLVGGGLAWQVAGRVYPFVSHDPRPPAVLDVVATRPGGLIFLPLGIQHHGLAWQTFLERPTLGGMGESAPIFWPEGHHRRLRNALLQMLKDATQGGRGTRPGVDDARAEVKGWGFRWVVLRIDLMEDRFGERPSWEDLVDQLSLLLAGHPVAREGKTVVWYIE